MSFSSALTQGDLAGDVDDDNTADGSLFHLHQGFRSMGSELRLGCFKVAPQGDEATERRMCRSGVQ
jgi:hypothetical protein